MEVLSLVSRFEKLIEGSLEVWLPTLWTVEKQSRVVKSAERRCSSAKVRRKKIRPREMLEKSRNVVFFQWCVCRVTWKVGLLKRRVRSHVVRDQKLHAVVAKSAFWSENVQNAPGSEHFLEFWCRKIARRCGEKRILKWTFTKQVRFGALLGVLMSKNCTRLWPEAHVQVKIFKNGRSRSTFWSVDVEKLHAAVARSTFPSQNVKKNWRSRSTFWSLMSKNCTRLWREAHFQVKMFKKTDALGALFEVWCRKIARRCGEKHVCEWKCTKHVRSGQFFEVLMSKNCMNLWREAHLSVKMYKIPVFWRAFSSSDVEQLVCGKSVNQSVS